MGIQCSTEKLLFHFLGGEGRYGYLLINTDKQGSGTGVCPVPAPNCIQIQIIIVQIWSFDIQIWDGLPGFELLVSQLDSNLIPT